MLSKKYWVITLVLFFLALTFFLWNVLYPFVIGFLLTFLLQPLVNFLEKLRIKKEYGIALVTFIFVILFVLFFILLAPALLKETYNLVLSLKDHLKETQKFFKLLADFIVNLGLPVTHEQIISHLSSQLNNLLAPFFNATISSLINGVQDILLILVLVPLTVYYILKDKASLTQIINSYFSEKTNADLKAIYHDSVMRIRGYIKSLFLSAAIITVVMLILLFIWDVKYPFALAVFAGMLSLIPYLGVIIQMVLIALIQIGSGDSISSILWLSCIQLIFNSFIGLYLQPKFTSMTIKTHPLFVIVTVMVGGYFYGITGMIFSIPIMIILQTAFEISVAKNNYKIEIKG